MHAHTTELHATCNLYRVKVQKAWAILKILHDPNSSLKLGVFLTLFLCVQLPVLLEHTCTPTSKTVSYVQSVSTKIWKGKWRARNALRDTRQKPKEHPEKINATKKVLESIHPNSSNYYQLRLISCHIKIRIQSCILLLSGWFFYTIEVSFV